MSKALTSFESSIKDAEDLLAHFDAMPKPPPANAEVLKRACLVMALTAWETYVEDRVREEVARRLRVVNGSYVGKFVAARLEDELRRFHNPTSDKTKKLFHDFLEVDVVTGWEWANYDSTKAKKTLDELISKRGDAVHRSKDGLNNSPPRRVAGRYFSNDGISRASSSNSTIFTAHSGLFHPLQGHHRAFGRTHTPASINFPRTIHKLDSANSVNSCAVFFFKPR